jgi:hybrid cluster-associated redox disulfide protein
MPSSLSLLYRKVGPGARVYRGIMARKQDPNPGMLISEFLRRHPETISVLVRNRMACAGCPMSPFETLADAMKAYGLNPARFLRELRKATLPRRS